ncbi:alpha/beta hydrolase [Arthrobacter sp. NPDC080031]|uniref:alpha/beta fold hydrolase n=1 Tax=Arthrobacter sp. NPDC080031 TaxID=3155918 RepID=UPI00344DC41F
MTVVMVHGNLETPAIWEPMREHLSTREIVPLSPPGFGAPVPASFGGTWVDYREWLIHELEQIAEPVHLFGHDWGGGHVMNVAMIRPDLLKSWASDTLGTLADDFAWHNLAQLWRDPVEGPKAVDELMGGTLEDRTRRLLPFGIPEATAAKIAQAMGPEMGRSLLALYGSAGPEALIEMREGLSNAGARPGLSIHATEDHDLGTMSGRHRAAGIARAITVDLPGRHHWWMLEDPTQAASILERFWESIDVP